MIVSVHVEINIIGLRNYPLLVKFINNNNDNINEFLNFKKMFIYIYIYIIVKIIVPGEWEEVGLQALECHHDGPHF